MAYMACWQDEICFIEAYLGGVSEPFSLSHFPLSGRIPDMTEILLTGTLSFNSINQSNVYITPEIEIFLPAIEKKELSYVP